MKKAFAAILSFLLIFTLFFSFSPEVYAQETGPDYFGTVKWYSTASAGETITDSFYFSDSWFFEDPAVQNDNLALASMQLTAAVSDADPNGLGISFLKDMGFEETGVSRYDSSDPFDLVYTWGKKSITNGSDTSTLICIAIQSYAFDKETKWTGWTQNFRINGDSETDEQYSFETAAGNVLPDIAALGASGPVKYWITGQSRGGALAGMLAAKLPSVSSVSNSDIFAYTFESPAVVNAKAAPDPANGNIHNYICSNDIVTKIPMWGMVRYGVDHRLNTEETDAKILETLKTFGSASAAVWQYYSTESIEDSVSDIIGALETTVPTRADYSAVHTDTVTDPDGKEQSISYNYQDLFLKLMDLIFKDGISDFNTDLILENLHTVLPGIQSLAKAINENSDSDYYQAAEGVEAFLSAAGLALPFDRAELYALLKLIGPVIIDPSYVPQSDPPTEEDVMAYLSPTLILLGEKDWLVFSHQFDTEIARLKVLAKDPVLDNIALVIPEPAAGDANTSAPEAVLSEIDDMDCSWITAASEFDSSDKTLQNDKVYYLSVTLDTIGHTVPEDFSFTINGNEPAAPLEISYADGVTTIQGQWAFTIGSPSEFTVSFEPNGHAEKPASVSVKNGEKLADVLTPEAYENVTDDQGIWRFDGWYDENGTFWKDLAVKEEVTLYAKWTKLVTAVEVTLPIPHVGDVLPVPSVPKGADYEIQDYYIEDEETYETISSIDTENPLMACVYVYAANGSTLLLEQDEWGFFNYVGTCSVNGDEADLSYDEDLECLRIYYPFTPLPAEDPATETPTPTPTETPKPTDTPKPTESAAPTPTDTPTPTETIAPTDTPAPDPTTEPTDEPVKTPVPKPTTAPSEAPSPSSGPSSESALYTLVGGSNARWTKGTLSSVTFTVKRSQDDETCFRHFTGVSIDGTALEANNYVAKAGSTVVTLYPSYLGTLSAADHTVTIQFDDGKVETGLTVAAAGSYTPSGANRSYGSNGSYSSYRSYGSYSQRGTPQTGDSNNPGQWLGMLITAAAAVVILTVWRRKKTGF